VSKHENKRQADKSASNPEAWISMRTGIIVIAITSVGMAVLTTIQALQTKGLLEAISWGVLFGVFIWAIFIGMLLINRLLGRR
jgi:hypothetical protein